MIFTSVHQSLLNKHVYFGLLFFDTGLQAEKTFLLFFCSWLCIILDYAQLLTFWITKQKDFRHGISWSSCFLLVFNQLPCFFGSIKSVFCWDYISNTNWNQNKSNPYERQVKKICLAQYERNHGEQFKFYFPCFVCLVCLRGLCLFGVKTICDVCVIVNKLSFHCSSVGFHFLLPLPQFIFSLNSCIHLHYDWQSE